jgi:hypothetical protein
VIAREQSGDGERGQHQVAGDVRAPQRRALGAEAAAGRSRAAAQRDDDRAREREQQQRRQGQPGRSDQQHQRDDGCLRRHHGVGDGPPRTPQTEVRE